MHNFEKRRDRFNTFASFENPLVNLSFEQELPDLRPWCKAQQLPPFHVLLFAILQSVTRIDNFMYRIHQGEVIKIDQILASYTVINQDGNLNFARFEMSNDLHEFVRRSLAAKQVAEASGPLINTAESLTPYQQRQNIFITCMPWLKLAAIEHPIYEHKSYDIPSLAWGKFGSTPDGMLTVPFAVQAHHGFVDGYHVHLLAEAIKARVASLMA
ncbi:MAG: CatA-like O-acetyltransferase [Sphingomonadaceae bacterium]